MTDHPLVEAVAAAIRPSQSCRDIARAALAAIEAADWRVVPVEPTKAMAKAGDETGCFLCDAESVNPHLDSAVSVYEAMLAAAPKVTEP